MSEKFRRVPEASARGYISRRRADLVMDRSKAAARNAFIDHMMSQAAKNDSRDVHDEFENLSLGQIIERMRVEEGFSRVELGRRANVDNTSIFRIETGRTKRPSRSLIADIASGFGLAMDDPRILRIINLREQEAELMKQRRSKK